MEYRCADQAIERGDRFEWHFEETRREPNIFAVLQYAVSDNRVDVGTGSDGTYLTEAAPRGYETLGRAANMVRIPR
jgi:hypothetical protein